MADFPTSTEIIGLTKHSKSQHFSFESNNTESIRSTLDVFFGQDRNLGSRTLLKEMARFGRRSRAAVNSAPGFPGLLKRLRLRFLYRVFKVKNAKKRAKVRFSGGRAPLSSQKFFKKVIPRAEAPSIPSILSGTVSFGLLKSKIDGLAEKGLLSGNSSRMSGLYSEK